MVFNNRGSITDFYHFSSFSTNSTPYLKVDVTTEIVEGQSAQLRLTNELSDGVHLYIDVDGHRVLTYYLIDTLDVSIPYLESGEHTVVIRNLEYYYHTIYFSKTLKINVTEKPVNENNTEIGNDDPVNSTVSSQPVNNSRSAVETQNTKDKISLTLKTVKVKKSSKKLVITATLKINGKLAKSKYLTFKFNGKNYKVKTNSKGVAKLTIKKSTLKNLKWAKK